MKLVEFDAETIGKLWVNPDDIVAVLPLDVPKRVTVSSDPNGVYTIVILRHSLETTVKRANFFSVKESPLDVVVKINRMASSYVGAVVTPQTAGRQT